jgi:Na+-driven multidrug efflux pump
MATTVRVGNLLGSGHAQMAKLAAETAIGMSLIVALALRYGAVIIQNSIPV